MGLKYEYLNRITEKNNEKNALNEMVNNEILPIAQNNFNAVLT